MLKKIKTSLLEIAYEEKGETGADTVNLMHGFPDDAKAWNSTTDELAEKGFFTLAFYARGYGKLVF